MMKVVTPDGVVPLSPDGLLHSESGRGSSTRWVSYKESETQACLLSHPKDATKERAMNNIDSHTIVVISNSICIVITMYLYLWR